MDNLEEVLQALDEFQKVRPSEIPRELEDYLCWVAKTGDPVYQWSLIKTLFREKLTRVMTEFYESCPTLDLAPCPNVEHFNYDMMKSNLLERLESFANAPFTVQRICELLTAPRKEYNRVDKFMRAIEKNILVVSTREPGPITRRNENGDGMVNGSVDEDPSVTQPPQDVEMEYWEKDCSSTVTISVHTVENETPLLHTVVPTNTVVKNVFDTEELSHEKVESTSKSDIVVSNFIQTSEFSGVSNLNSQTQTQDSQIGSAIQNLSTIVPENSGIISDVSEAIMNEDTSSQPSLELINEGGDAVDSSRKLQTTFQTKDFSTNENKSTKFYIDNSKINEKTEVELMSIHVQEGSKSKDILVKSDIELKTVLDNKESISPIVENLNTNKNLENTIKLDTGVENIQSIIDTSTSNKKSLDVESTSTTNNSEQLTNNLILSTDNISTEETINTSENLSVDIENLKDQTKEVELIKNSKSIKEEPCSKTNITKHFNQNQKKIDLTITEIGEDEGSIIKTIVPDPIPIVEEPKNIESIKIKENISPIIEITEKSENLQNSPIICQSENKETISIKDSNVAQLQGNNITSTINKIHDSDTVIENIMNKKEQKEVELMDVDEEETLSVFQQDDEVMEQETVQSSRS
ncbi:serine/threonine-protein phosphatase 4 regulatory subunit 2 [Apis mellifera caucasica]|uniref:Serine/threonine-protein phosphatase 4 regulatory subunit 2 n=1 Tax=Apis mellifera TaxID=7460 RepID=A0A7M7GAY1_APIME|nr:serine/threonine-protein phosphatase 4 regulatory subunit 2 [Apis mellifera]KAG6799859.1 serine/threonine-protein phosphatase 4 regulatory subunit 2 [Apis mellifera caucasica]KAG9435779.1 serine/threonine-protein phosphatase 4 regulatory subunit 2 [Apis mellifera carnica]|eukprot:XP_003250884.1 serine/threonine-protein phosphatase 4 regulatory subunit 2 [Apis mellifera]